MFRTWIQRPNFAALLWLAWTIVVIQLLVQHWPETARTLYDTDDAMRLVQMRSWLAGQGWFDLHQARLQPPTGYDSHWSRLIDAGLAGLLWLLGIFAEPAFAERMMRATWPLLWVLPTLVGMVAIAWRLAGREAAIAALLLAVAGVPAYHQFVPGRVDHHNVQIALTMLVVAATVWSDRQRWCAIVAGALTGFALAVGFECLPYVAACAAALALRYVLDASAAGGFRAYLFSLLASTLIGFLINVGPDHWTRSLCDALAFNSAAAIAGGTLGLALLASWVDGRALTRGMAVVVAGAGCLSILAATEPRCLAGPYAMVDPAIWPIWLGDVRENQPMLRVFAENPLTAAAIAAFPMAALIAALALARVREWRQDFAFLVVAASLVVAIVITIATIRTFSYAMWLGMPVVAAAALRLFAVLRIETLPARVFATLMLTPLVVSSGAITVASAAGFEDTKSFARPESKHCLTSAAYAPLAALPPGLVFTDISYGPFLLALTPHSAMAAPYHRMSHGIVTAHRALAVPPAQARDILSRSGATYVMSCGPRPPDGLMEPERSRSLWGRLQAGDVPDWLEWLPASRDQAFAVYRLRP